MGTIESSDNQRRKGAQILGLTATVAMVCLATGISIGSCMGGPIGPSPVEDGLEDFRGCITQALGDGTVTQDEFDECDPLSE